MWIFGIAEENEPFLKENVNNQIFWNSENSMFFKFIVQMISTILHMEFV